jgi:DNA modification methylase
MAHPTKEPFQDSSFWPAHQVEIWPIERLKPSPTNARLHTKADVELVKDSITRSGWTNPMLTDEDGNIIAGHCRRLAAIALGLKRVPVVVARGWTDAQKRSHRLWDNQSTLRGTWDLDVLRSEIDDLKLADCDIAWLGFEPEELERLGINQNEQGLTDPDAVPEVPTHPTSRVGDIYRLGPHRAACGDSTDPDHVAALLGDTVPKIMVTDIPYGVDYDPTWREGHHLGVGKRSKGKVLNDDRADWRAAYKLFPGNVAYVWHGAVYSGVCADGLRACDFEIRSHIVWAKQHFVISRGDYHWQHETCWYAVRKGWKSSWIGGRKQSTIWEIANNGFGNSEREQTWGHGTQKPVEVMRRPIVNNCPLGDVVYDPFLGSGTTLIAAVQSGRICFGMELSPAYVDVIVRRWQQFTGQEAVLIRTGQTFNEYSANP